MKAEEFIKNRIDDLVNQISFIKCSYRYDADSFVHLIEVLPLNIYKSNEKYISIEENIVFDFIECFPKENINFISSDSIVKMDDSEYSKTGNLFGLVNDFSVNVCSPDIQLIEPIFGPVIKNKHSIIDFWDERTSKNYSLNESVTINNLYETANAMAA